MRRKNDFYPTETALTLALVDSLPELVCGHVYEPCVGTGNISSVLKGFDCKVLTNDIDPQFTADFNDDAKKFWPQELKESHFINYGWTVTNPPFNQAYEILNNALTYCNHVAFLLRLSFLEPVKKRELLLSMHPPSKILVLPRTSFTQDGKTDSVTCAWMIWTPHDGEKEIKVYTKKDLANLVDQYEGR